MSLPVHLSIVGVGLGTSHVRGLRFIHELSRPWRVHLEVGSSDPDIDLDRVMGAEARLDLPGESLLPSIVGVVESAAQSAVEASGESTYLFEIAPRLGLLAHRRSQRIFQHQDVVATVAQLLAEHALPAPAPLLLEAHPDREYTVQWKESDLDFALRLLAEDGITLITDPARDGISLVDDTRTRTSLLPVTLGFRPDADALRDTGEPPSFRAVHIARRVTAGRQIARDYDFERPEFVPEGQEAAGPPPGAAPVEGRLDVYEFQVGAADDEAAAQLEARRRMHALRTDARTLRVSSNAMVPAGVRIRLAGHPRSDVDGAVLVIGSETRWEAGARSDELLCIPEAVAFRPRRLPKPRVHGTHTAFVVTPLGEEIDVDEHGRVMVEFRWDNRDLHAMGTSRRVRVGQPWAGGGFGMTLIPRRNEEVIVAYLDGDPDEPIIAGRVHNGWSRDPLQLPAERTQSIWKSRSVPSPEDGSAFNMIRMEDAASSEMLELRAQRDFRSETLRNSETIVGVDESKKVGGSSKTEVAGAYSLKSGSTSIGTGAYNVSASSITMHASGDIKETSGGNHTIDTGSFWVSAKGVAQISAKKIVLMAGGSNITLTPDGITIKAPTIEIASPGLVDVHGSPIKLNC